MSTIQFAEFELNESSRELRLRNRELALQPRVFDLLCYLIRNRDRVVSKDELLAALWPGVIVTEGSLQRAISLARSALRQGGLTDAIRTHARSGYRFCMDISEQSDETSTSHIPDVLSHARRSYDHYDWETAIQAFEQADSQRALEGPDLERWADAIQCTGQSWNAVAPLERAVAAHTSQNDTYGAARAMLNLANVQFEQREMAVAKAWHQRAARLIPRDEISREYGTWLWIGSRFAAISGELEQAKDYATQAHKIGCELPDSDIEVLGLNYLGVALQALGNFKEGAELQDEAAAAVLAGDVSPIVGGLIYCGVIWSCRNRGDWERAAQWTDHFTRWCKSSPLHNLPGTCRLHRAEVLSVRGKLDEAESEAKAMCESLSARAPWAEGDAYQVLGNIYLLRGDLDQAETAFRRAYELGWDPQPGYALLQVARGANDVALKTLESSLADSSWANQQKRGLLLANYVVVSIGANDIERAQNALSELDRRPELYTTDSLHAVVYRARAEVSQYLGNLNEAIGFYRQAIQLWQNVGSPLNIAMMRLLLAKALLKQNNAHLAELELCAAESCFQKSGAAKLLDNCIRLKQQILTAS
jgi:DNA-binding winged helix-turn-helix (wHTH) protein/Tfp pilus assembly protein PilF